jgi:glucose/arabinose dehydrogenase
MLTVSHYTDGVIQKMIAGGDGIRVTEENGRITITATGGGGSSGGDDVVTSGYSGTVVAATNPRYDESSHRLLYTPVSMKFEKGLMKSIQTGSESVIAQAVEESA